MEYKIIHMQGLDNDQIIELLESIRDYLKTSKVRGALKTHIETVYPMFSDSPNREDIHAVLDNIFIEAAYRFHVHLLAEKSLMEYRGVYGIKD